MLKVAVRPWKPPRGYEKSPVPQHRGFHLAIYRSHSAGDLTGTEASGADVYVGGSTLHDRLHALHVGLPGTVGTAVGVETWMPKVTPLSQNSHLAMLLTSSL